MNKTAKIDQTQDFFGITGDVFRLINQCWEAFKFNFTTLLAIILVPVVIVMALAAVAVLPIIISNNFSAINIAILAISGVIALIIMAIFLPAMIITQLESVKAKKVDFKDVVKKSAGMALPFLGLSILIGLITLLGFILLVIPGFLAIFFLSLATYIYVDKKPSIKDTIKQSYHLVKNNWRLVFAMYIVNLVISLFGMIPIAGWAINLVLSIAYFCLPAVIYMQIRRSTKQ